MESLTETKRGHGGVGFLEGDWQERLALIDKTMREMSLQDDPQSMVRSYATRIRKLMPAAACCEPADEPRGIRITRSSTWTEEINPGSTRTRLPPLWSELIYGDQPG
jgi:sigma-B regulation protein RsbU (phosphoserine phosphatase)